MKYADRITLGQTDPTGTLDRIERRILMTQRSTVRLNAHERAVLHWHSNSSVRGTSRTEYAVSSVKLMIEESRASIIASVTAALTGEWRDLLKGHRADFMIFDEISTLKPVKSLTHR